MPNLPKSPFGSGREKPKPQDDAFAKIFFESFHGKSEDFEIFTEPRERLEVFEYSEAIAEYVRMRKIPNIVIVDRSSRPLYVGVREYLRNKYPEEKLPNFYFFNPQGFQSKEELNEDEIAKKLFDALIDGFKTLEEATDRAAAERSFDEFMFAMEAEKNGETSESQGLFRTEAAISTELHNVYKRLVKDKDKPLLVFDTCIHTGDTLYPIKKTLVKNGFSNILIGSINPSPRNSKVKADVWITTERPERGCYPFDRDRLVEKTPAHIYSMPSDDQRKQDRARQIRQEIKWIIKAGLTKKPKMGRR